MTRTGSWSPRWNESPFDRCFPWVCACAGRWQPFVHEALRGRGRRGANRVRAAGWPAMSRKPRVLSPEEKRLWRRVAGDAKPLDKEPARKVPEEVPKRRPRPETRDTFEIPEFRIGEKAVASSGASQESGRTTVRMDQRKFTRMKRGKTTPDARIDLHGKTAAEGRAALVSFLLNAHRKGHRTILVITGKGRERNDAGPIPERPGILRQQLPHWISSAPLDQIVLQCTEAHPRHGGSGAFYVYLARR